MARVPTPAFSCTSRYVRNTTPSTCVYIYVQVYTWLCTERERERRERADYVLASNLISNIERARVRVHAQAPKQISRSPILILPSLLFDYTSTPRVPAASPQISPATRAPAGSVYVYIARVCVVSRELPVYSFFCRRGENRTTSRGDRLPCCTVGNWAPGGTEDGFAICVVFAM